MNILSGRFKGAKINTSFKSIYRPTKSRVRKSLFDKLQSLENKNFLDLFSGTGIMGFEASSRGANSIIFVENNRDVVRLLNDNIKKFSKPYYKIYKMDYLEFLKKPLYFDFIFADPPYGVYDLRSLVKSVMEHLNLNGTFILECNRKEHPFFEANVLDYGKTRLLYWEKK
jgi:16S rRNA (guanine(966)-N(2))-methyltransferase RsmD